MEALMQIPWRVCVGETVLHSPLEIVTYLVLIGEWKNRSTHAEDHGRVDLTVGEGGAVPQPPPLPQTALHSDLPGYDQGME